MVAILGPYGCGKTTLLNCLSGLGKFDQGEVYFERNPLSQMRDEERDSILSHRMGFVFQYHNLQPLLNAVNNTMLPLIVAGQDINQAYLRAGEALAQVGLSDFGKHRPAELTGVQRQRLAIARAIINQPAILWADEPTGNLASESSEEVIQLLCRLNQVTGQTTVVFTHDPSIARCARRTIHLHEGVIIDPHALRSRDQHLKNKGFGNSLALGVGFPEYRTWDPSFVM
jgi:putative ABC transport system ATP-binding protein